MSEISPLEMIIPMIMLAIGMLIEFYVLDYRLKHIEDELQRIARLLSYRKEDHGTEVS